MKIFLTAFLIAVLVSISDSEGSKDVSVLKWTNSLDTPDKLTAFLGGDTMMARETVILGKDADGADAVVMGGSVTGTLTLKKCLDDVKGKEGNTHGLVLEIPSVEVYKAVEAVLEAYKDEKWITLSFTIFTGPQGSAPTISAEEMKDIKSNFPMSFSSTFGHETGKEKGYATDFVNTVKATLTTAAVTTIDTHSFVVDAFHISHTEGAVLTEIQNYLKEWHTIELMAANEDGVNIEELKTFLGGLDRTKCFLNVPDTLRAQISEEVNPPDKPEGPGETDQTDGPDQTSTPPPNTPDVSGVATRGAIKGAMALSFICWVAFSM